MTRAPAFVDANIPGYSAGREHDLREWSLRILDHVARLPELYVSDVEMLQEILHRYRAVGRSAQARTLVAEMIELLPGRIEPIYADDVARATELAMEYPRLSARDLLHLAVMRRLGVTAIVTADAAFGDVLGVEWLHPSDFDRWGPELERGAGYS